MYIYTVMKHTGNNNSNNNNIIIMVHVHAYNNMYTELNLLRQDWFTTISIAFSSILISSNYHSMYIKQMMLLWH